MTWAILSGIQGNLTAYEAVLADIKRQRNLVEEIYILGDVVGLTPDSEKLVQRLRSPHRNEIKPMICKGWWEEQCLILHSLGATSEPVDLIRKYGANAVKLLWDSVSRTTVEWIRNLDFGFFEFDSLLIHGSTVAVDEELTPETSPLVMCDRTQRMQANNLFCGRSGQTFLYQITAGEVTEQVTTLDSQSLPQTATTTPLQIIGVGNVGRSPLVATYTLYNPFTNQVDFRTVCYGAGKGFQPGIEPRATPSC